MHAVPNPKPQRRSPGRDEATPAGPPDAPGRPDGGRLITEAVLEEGLPEEQKRENPPPPPPRPARG